MRNVVSPISMALVHSRRVAVAGRSGSRDNVPVDPNSGGGGWRIVLDSVEMGPEHDPIYILAMAS